MGVEKIVTYRHVCDSCHKTKQESEMFAAKSQRLWSDRDVVADVTVSVKLEISYVSSPQTICKACAIGFLEDEIKRLRS